MLFLYGINAIVILYQTYKCIFILTLSEIDQNEYREFNMLNDFFLVERLNIQ